MEHETTWNSTAVGGAAPACHKAVEEGPVAVLRCPGPEFICEQRIPLVAGFSKERHERIATCPGFRTSLKADLGPEAKADAYPLAQCLGGRIRHGLVDLGADRGRDPATLRSALSSLPRLEAAAQYGLVLPEARNQGERERRGSHRALEALPVAPYKKKPNDLGPISSSSTKAASSCFPTSVGLGHPKDRRRFCAVPGTGRRFRPSRPWWCRRAVDAWRSTPGSIRRRTSIRFWRRDSWATCSKRCEGQSYFFGMVAASTKDRPSGSSFVGIGVCTRFASRATRLSSTLRSGSGSSSKTPWPTVRPRTCATSRAAFIVRSSGFASPRSCCGPASMLPISHGNDKPSFHYLCKGQ